MWQYEKKLQFPVRIKNPNPRLAKIIINQYGGPNGESAAAMRYLSQRFTMPHKIAKGILNDVGTEELAHWEIVGSIVSQLLKGASEEQIIKEYGPEYATNGIGVFPQWSSGVPFTAAVLASTSDPVTNLVEDLAAEQKARSTYEWLIDQTDDPDVLCPLRFLREREVVHFQRFGEPNHTNLRRFSPC